MGKVVFYKTISYHLIMNNETRTLIPDEFENSEASIHPVEQSDMEALVAEKDEKIGTLEAKKTAEQEPYRNMIDENYAKERETEKEHQERLDANYATSRKAREQAIQRLTPTLVEAGVAEEQVMDVFNTISQEVTGSTSDEDLLEAIKTVLQEQTQEDTEIQHEVLEMVVTQSTETITTLKQVDNELLSERNQIRGELTQRKSELLSERNGIRGELAQRKSELLAQRNQIRNEISRIESQYDALIEAINDEYTPKIEALQNPTDTPEKSEL